MQKIGSENYYDRAFKKRMIFLLFLIFLLVIVTIFSITLGVASITFSDTIKVLFGELFGIGSQDYSSFSRGIVMNLRLPRIALAIITGLALGSSGSIMQSILKNPLASPYTLGIASGSAFGAAAAIVLGDIIFKTIFTAYSSWFIILGAFSFGLLTILIINLIVSLKEGSSAMLILAGVALGYLFSAGVSFLRYVTDHEQLRELAIWLMGGFYQAEWRDIFILTPILILSLSILLKISWDVNALSAGEEVAQNLGIDIRKLRRIGTVTAAFLTSSVVAFTGIIGFVGLVAPHICRMIIGNDNRFLTISSGLAGALFLLGADTAARLIISPAELPVGIITSFFGAPFFIYMLIKKRRSYWS